MRQLLIMLVLISSTPVFAETFTALAAYLRPGARIHALLEHQWERVKGRWYYKYGILVKDAERHAQLQQIVDQRYSEGRIARTQRSIFFNTSQQQIQLAVKFKADFPAREIRSFVDHLNPTVISVSYIVLGPELMKEFRQPVNTSVRRLNETYRGVVIESSEGPELMRLMLEDQWKIRIKDKCEDMVGQRYE